MDQERRTEAVTINDTNANYFIIGLQCRNVTFFIVQGELQLEMDMPAL